MILSLHHDRPESESSFTRFQSSSVLKGLKALDSRARRKGLDALDPERGALVPIGMEIENGRVVKNGYGVFDLPWQAEEHPEWPEKIAAELEEVREGLRAAHKVPVKFLIWAGMGGSAEDKAMYQAVGLLRRGPRFYLLDSTDPLKLDSILADMKKRSGLSEKDLLRRTLVVGMAMGMTSYEPVVNLQKLAAIYDAAGIDSRPNFYYMTLPGSLLDQFAAKRGYRRVPLQLDEGNSTAGRHSAPMNRGSLYPLGLAGVDLKAWIEATFLSDEEVATAWRLASFLHVQGLEGREKVTLVLPREWAGRGYLDEAGFRREPRQIDRVWPEDRHRGAGAVDELSAAQGSETGSGFFLRANERLTGRLRGEARAGASRRVSGGGARFAEGHVACPLHAVRALRGVRARVAEENQLRHAAECRTVQIDHQQIVRGV